MRRIGVLCVAGIVCSSLASAQTVTESDLRKAMDDLNSPRGREAEMFCSVKLGFKMVPKNAIEAGDLYGDDKAADYIMCYMDRMNPNKR